MKERFCLGNEDEEEENFDEKLHQLSPFEVIL